MTFRQMLALFVAASPAILCSCACERKASAAPRQAKAAAPQQEATTTAPPTTGTSEWTTVAGSTSDAPSVTDNPENIVVRRGEAGNIEAEGAMLDGKQHGDWTFYWPNGNLKGKGAFDQGVRSGPWMFWEEDGSKATAGAFIDGKPDGVWEHWYPNGVRKAEQTFRDGKMHGLTRTWDEFGRIQQEVTFNADIPLTLDGRQAKHGPFAQYNADGIKVEEGQYDHDMRAGVWIYRFNTGQISKAGRYYDGEELGLWIFGKEGQAGYKGKKRLVNGRDDILGRDFEMMEIVFGPDRSKWPMDFDSPAELDPNVRPGDDIFFTNPDKGDEGNDTEETPSGG